MSTTFRTTISIDGGIAEAAGKMAKVESRSFSNLCEVALAEYCSSNSELGMDAVISAANEIGVQKALAALHRAARPNRKTRKAA